MPNSFDTENVFAIVNSVFQQMTGRTDVTATDSNSLIAMGETIESLGRTELWLNTIVRRISKTIDTFRPYKSKFSLLSRSAGEWGAIVQKLTVNMPDAVTDDMFKVGEMDGQSLDQWIIKNPKVIQKFYDNEAPYSYFITIQDGLLKRAFTSPGAMSSFITQIFGNITNKREAVHEELARIALANLVLNLKETQEFKLVTLYNTAHGTNFDGQQALNSDTFLRWANAFINKVSRNLTMMSVLYNQADEGFNNKFTPENDQMLFMHTEFKTALECLPDYLAFAHPVMKSSADIPYWQANARVDEPDWWETVSSIKGTKADGSESEVTNLLALLIDKNAVGTFRQEVRVYTTPINARGGYYNTFWHENNTWFNDLDENAIAFYLE